jgi:hypothetical protein
VRHGASAAPAQQGTAQTPVARRRRIARWRPPVAVAAVVLGLIGGQAISLGIVLALGSSEPSVWDGIGLLLTDAFLIGVIMLFARKGAAVTGHAGDPARRPASWRAWASSP